MTADRDRPTDTPITVRPARRRDVGVMVELVRALADYERAADQVQLDEAGLTETLFRDSPKVFAHVAVRAPAGAPGEPEAGVVGFAVWFVNYSTWTGRHGIYLEDLFVRPSARGLGAGRALLTELAATAVARGYTRVEWAVLDWNEPAAGFYRHLGARPQDDWTVYRLSGPALNRLGRPAEDPVAGKDGQLDVSRLGVTESYLQE